MQDSRVQTMPLEAQASELVCPRTCVGDNDRTLSALGHGHITDYIDQDLSPAGLLEIARRHMQWQWPHEHIKCVGRCSSLRLVATASH